MDWRDCIEKNTGEVATVTVAASLGIKESDILWFVRNKHGARYVGGTSRFLIWKEDAEELERQQKRQG